MSDLDQMALNVDSLVVTTTNPDLIKRARLNSGFV